MAVDIKPAGPVELFNGKDLTGWVSTLQGDSAESKVWPVLDGMLRCSGQPYGYLRTEKTWTNYHLMIEWRWTRTVSGKRS